MSIPAHKLKGQSRSIILLDNSPRDLRYDFNAVMTLEETLSRFGLNPEEEKARLLQEVAAQAKAKAEGVEYVPPAQKGPGFFRTISAAAYALTASWREDNDEEMTFAQFRRLLPVVKPGEGWAKIVNDIMAAEQEPLEGNDPSPDATAGGTEPDASEATEQTA